MTGRLMTTDQSVERELAEETDTREKGTQFPLVLPQITHDLTWKLTQVARKLLPTAYSNNILLWHDFMIH